MGEFLDAYIKTAKWEGGYSNLKKDRGGETYAGISRKYHPKWEGWSIVDACKPLKHNQKIDSTSLASMVKQFYYYGYWLPVGGDYIDSQCKASFIYDWHVNSGKAAIREIQAACGVTKDGVIGKVTLGKIDETSISVFIQARLKYVEDIVRRDPSQKDFLQGWKNRINSW